MFIYLPGPSARQEGRRAKRSPVGCYTVSDGFEDDPTRLTTSDVGDLVRTRERLKVPPCWGLSGSTEETEMPASGRHTNQMREEEPGDFTKGPPTPPLLATTPWDLWGLRLFPSRMFTVPFQFILWSLFHFEGNFRMAGWPRRVYKEGNSKRGMRLMEGVSNKGVKEPVLVIALYCTVLFKTIYILLTFEVCFQHTYHSISFPPQTVL